MCYIKDIKGVTAHKVVDLPDDYISLPDPPRYKVGLFISACYSYLCRQAMQRETNHPKITGLKLRMYSYASPPFSFKLGRLSTLQHDYSMAELYHIFSFSTITLLKIHIPFLSACLINVLSVGRCKLGRRIAKKL